MSKTMYPLNGPERDQLLQNLIDSHIRRTIGPNYNRIITRRTQNNTNLDYTAGSQHRTQRADFLPPANGIEFIDLDTNRDAIKQTTWGLS